MNHDSRSPRAILLGLAVAAGLLLLIWQGDSGTASGLGICAFLVVNARQRLRATHRRPSVRRALVVGGLGSGGVAALLLAGSSSPAEAALIAGAIFAFTMAAWWRWGRLTDAAPTAQDREPPA